MGQSRSPKAILLARAPEITLSEEARAIYSAWCSLFTVGVPLTPAIAKAAQGLVEPVARWSEELHVAPAELLKRMKNWLYEMDKKGYYKRGVKLFDLEREFEGWQSAMERERHHASEQSVSSSASSLPDYTHFSDEEYYAMLGGSNE